MSKKTTSDMNDAIHGLVGRQLIDRLESEECTSADIRNAMDWLHRNGWTSANMGDLAAAAADAERRQGTEEPKGPRLPDWDAEFDEDEEAA